MKYVSDVHVGVMRRVTSSSVARCSAAYKRADVGVPCIRVPDGAAAEEAAMVARLAASSARARRASVLRMTEKQQRLEPSQ